MGSGQVMHMVGKSVTKLIFNISLIINQQSYTFFQVTVRNKHKL